MLFLREIDGGAEAFKPLSEAYSIPKDDPRRGEVMEAALAAASEPPMRMMELACRTLDLLSELREKCSVLAISDVGVGALLAVAALRGASLNVVINIKSMADRDAAGALRARVDAMLGKYVPLAEEIYLAVTEKIS